MGGLGGIPQTFRSLIQTYCNMLIYLVNFIANGEYNMEKYTFNGHVIKLKKADYDRWEQAYKNIPNLQAHLFSRDEWFHKKAEYAQKTRWYLSTASYLAKLDAQYAKDNATDEMGRKIDANGKKVFRTLP